MPVKSRAPRNAGQPRPSTAMAAIPPVLAAALASAEKPLKIVFVSAEVAPWSKTGGLGDVAGGLPIALADRGHQVLTVAPRYDQYYDAWDTSVTSDLDGSPGSSVRYFHTLDKGVDRVWIDHPSFLSKVEGKTGSKLYGSKSGADYADNLQRFKLFNLAALEALRVLPFSPGEDALIVCNDWHTALLPVLLKDVFQPRGEFLQTKTALVIHNIAFQGRFWASRWSELGLPDSSRQRFQFKDGWDRVFDETEDIDEDAVPKTGVKYEKLNWLRAGLLTADKLLTVSPTYAEEMASGPDMGVELDDVIRSVGGIEGIVNGMDTSEWCPTQDKCLDVKYDEETVAEGKAAAKESLQAVVGLPVDAKAPLFGFIGRLEEQKGVDILLEALPEILGGGSKCQVIVLGTGKPALEQKTEAINTKFPRRGVGIVEFNGPLAHLMTAGCDFMLVPSRFEPCGLIQMHAMQYGTVPVVASTGGLVDTVKDGVTGFHCGKMDSEGLKPQDVAALAKVIKRASAAYGTPAFEEMRAKCIGQELSWQVPAAKWEAVLQDVRAGKPNKGPSNTFSPTPVKNVNKPAEVKKSSILSGQSNPKPRNLGEAVQGATGGNNGSWQGSSGRQATSAANAPRNAAAGPTPPAAGAAASKPSQPATIARKGEKADVSTSKAAAAVKAASAGASKPK